MFLKNINSGYVLFDTNQNLTRQLGDMLELLEFILVIISYIQSLLMPHVQLINPFLVALHMLDVLRVKDMT